MILYNDFELLKMLEHYQEITDSSEITDSYAKTLSSHRHEAYLNISIRTGTSRDITCDAVNLLKATLSVQQTERTENFEL